MVAQPYHEAYEFDFQADQTCKKNGKVYVLGFVPRRCLRLRTTMNADFLHSATKALGKMQHEDWTDVGEKLGRDDLRGVLMPGGHAKDLSSTFPRLSVKCEDNWNEVRVLLLAQLRSREVAVFETKRYTDELRSISRTTSRKFGCATCCKSDYDLGESRWVNGGMVWTTLADYEKNHTGCAIS